MKHFAAAFFIALFSITLLSGCVTTGGSANDKRKDINSMRNRVISDLYSYHPAARNMIASAPGYAVFSNVNVNVVLASFSGGQGVVRDNRTGMDTYMKMGEAGIGLGLGAKDFRAVFIFHDDRTMERFMTQGWEFGVHADAAAKAGEKGGAVGGEILANNMTIYQLTETGLALQATVKGTKYWRDSNLN